MFQRDLPSAPADWRLGTIIPEATNSRLDSTLETPLPTLTIAQGSNSPDSRAAATATATAAAAGHRVTVHDSTDHDSTIPHASATSQKGNSSTELVISDETKWDCRAGQVPTLPSSKSGRWGAERTRLT
ncbi:hypothetical protein E4U43_002541, partial [Claviceps pusilla]